MSRRDYRQRLRSVADRYGFKLDRTRNGHLVLRRTGVKPIYCSGTPSDWRELKNTESLVRRELRQASSGGRRG